jgi:hypothetical protein
LKRRSDKNPNISLFAKICSAQRRRGRILNLSGRDSRLATLPMVPYAQGAWLNEKVKLGFIFRPQAASELGPLIPQQQTRCDCIGCRFGANSGIVHRSKKALFDHLVGADEHREGYGEAQRFGSLHVDHRLEFGRLLCRQIGRLGAFEDLVHVPGCVADQIG